MQGLWKRRMHFQGSFNLLTMLVSTHNTHTPSRQLHFPAPRLIILPIAIAIALIEYLLR